MSFDLTNKNISDTFQNLLQKTGSDNRLYDLEGNEVTDLRINGTLTADQYVVSSSVTNVTFQQQSGSTIFGDSSDDSHTFQGHITASGNISSSGTGVNYFGGDITVAGEISASGTLYIGNNIYLNNQSTVRHIQTSTNDIVFNSGQKNFNFYTGSEGSSVVIPQLFISGSGGNVGIGTKNPTKALQVTGDISASGDLYLESNKKIQFDSADTSIYTNTDILEDLYIEADDDIYIRPDDNLVIAHGTTNYVTFRGDERAIDITGNITASGNISASGNITSSGLYTSGNIYAEQITSSIAGGGILSDSYSYRGGDITFWSSSLNLVGAISWKYHQIIAGSREQQMILTGHGHLGIKTVALIPPEVLTVGGAISSSGASYYSKHTFANDDATPSVEDGTYFETGTNSDTITTFDDGKIGQIIYVISKAAITYDVTSTALKGGTTDIVTATSDLTSWLYDGSNWTLISYTDQSDNSN